MKSIKTYIFQYRWGARFIEDETRQKITAISKKEMAKPLKRYDIINELLQSFPHETKYLEIGVRNPKDNFEKINANVKHSVDPGVEFKENPVDFQLTSDAFFEQLKSNTILSSDYKWDVIFIDGLHLADQVERDIENALQFLTDTGYLVLHDCNPPTEWHARENYGFDLTPAEGFWNGTTWKAVYKARFNSEISVACIDTDWGTGIVMKNKTFPALSHNFNPFFEFSVFQSRRKESLNLMDWEHFKSKTGL